MKEKWVRKVLFFLSILLIPCEIDAGSIREVALNVERVRSIEPPFRFGVIGDSQGGEKVYAQLIQRILGRSPRFLIHLGDMITRPSEKEWKRFFEISRPVNVPFFPVIGNHETGKTHLGEEMYRKQFSLPEGKTYYTFRAGGGLFVILDSEAGKGRIVDDQRSWLEKILSSSEERFKFVFLHRPLFLPIDSLKRGRAMDRYPLDRDELHRIFLRNGVKAVFAGDDHRYDRIEKEKILYLISGGGGSPIYAFKDQGGFSITFGSP
ncbi:MAG: metallophosphoesterase [Syntrophaceae bacterium]|nr:metallophosphoesterase [Syntrophaceae bacterium]